MIIIIKLNNKLTMAEKESALERRVTNLRSEAHVELKTANREWNDCIGKNFLPQWLAGEKLNIEEVCIDQKTRMDEADAAIYAEKPLPVQMFTLPTASQ